MTPLKADLMARLRAAGLAEDPAIETIAEWNRAAAIAAQLNPERAGFRDHWKQADLRRLTCH